MDADVYVPAVRSLGRCFSCWRWDIMSLPIDHWPAETVLPFVGMDVEGQPSTEAKRSLTALHATPLMLSVARPKSFVMLLVLLRIRHWERTYMFPPFDCCADAIPAGVATLFHVLSQSPLTRLPPPHSILSANVHYIPFWGCLHPSHSNRHAYRNERCR